VKNLFIVLILLTLLIVGCGDTVSTQLNAENYKNQLDDARRENAGLQQEIKDLKNDIKNLNIGLENSRKREKQAVCLRELSETPKEFKTQAMEDKCLAITK
tara:strand:+ start:292 stop:594 length:303 start_codon:yes stop_codon:yes gene_type:complete